MDALTETMRTTCLSGGPGEPEQLLFNPQADSGLAEMALDDIPRYLFRVVSPRSDGETNATWVRSASASQNTDSSLEDIFFNLNSGKRTTIARALNLHLRWWPKNGLEDNFVSWTSSLLFAIQYIYYRHLSSKDGSNVEEIKLYVIDTTLFPRGTFIRDLDLIEAFWKFDDHPEGKNLKNLRALRNDPRYYFGEYISQGSLKIAYKHRTISGKSLFDRDLLQRLQPEFSNIQSTPSKKPDWVKEVLRLRGDIWTVTKETLSSAKMLDRLKAVGEIVSNFQPGWGFPLAIYFAALIGSESATEDQGKANDNVIFGYFRSEQFNGKGASMRCQKLWSLLPPKTNYGLAYKQTRRAKGVRPRKFQCRRTRHHA
jgi:hypothetical protein